MNKKSLLFIITTSLLLSGCSFSPTRPSTSGAPSTTTQVSTSTSQPTSSIPPSSSGKDLENLEVKLTAINDYHGVIEENTGKGYVGLAKLTTYLKDRKSAGSILINSGDVYQGTFIANYDKGQLISETFKDIGFDAHTIGNHEFDWPVEDIKKNEQWQGQTFLGANIYNYPKQNNTWVKSELGDKYRVVTLNQNTDAEIKVGIIGVIGKDQLSSIDSFNVQNYIFLDATESIKSISTELRAAGCDIIVADYHSGEFDESITSTSAGKRYVDAIFTSHTHQMESGNVNGVPYVQAGEYGEGAAEVTLKFNKVTGEVSCLSAQAIYLSSLGLTADQNVQTKVNELKAKVDPIGNQIVGTNNGGYMNAYNVSRFYAKLAADKASTLGYNVDYVLFNYSRSTLYAGEISYSSLFATHPFMNRLFILSCTEANISEEISFGQIGYNVCGATPGTGTARKDVLVFSYNGFHQAVNSKNEKYYNYFDTGFDSGASHTPIEITGVNVFDLAIDWLKTNSITKSSYSGDNFI